MSKRTFSILSRLLTPAFVKLRLLQVLLVCAVLLVFVKLEKVYSLSASIFVHSAKAGETPDKKPTQPAAPAKPETAPSPTPAPAASAAPAAPAAPEKPAAATPAKSEFPTEKPKEGFKAESFDILELSPEQVEVLRTLSKRHRDLVQRERSISEREATLQAIEQRLDQKTGELKKIQEYLQQLLGQKTEKEQEALKKLVIVYEKMKPAEAATILQGLDMETLLNIMDSMKDGKVSAIVAKMEPKQARVLTIELAQRRKKLEERMKMEHDANAASPELTPAAAPAGVDPAHPAAQDPGKPVPSAQPNPAAPAGPPAGAPAAPPAAAPANAQDSASQPKKS